MDDTPEIDGNPMDIAFRSTGIVGLLGIGLIHFVDLFTKLKETPYLGGLYIALIAGCLTAAALLLRPAAGAGWGLAAFLSAATFAGYVLSRTTGLPASRGDVGNWTEPLGLASLFVEGVVLAMSVAALAGVTSRPRRKPPASQVSLAPLGDPEPSPRPARR